MVNKLCALSAVLLMMISQSLACTALNIQAEDSAVTTGRTMEWAYEMQWQASYYPKGSEYFLTAEKSLKLKPIAVKSKYAVFGITTALAENSMLEGQNSAGLSLSANFLPGFTEYQKVEKSDSKYMSILEFGKFTLGNFASVNELLTELPNYKVWTGEQGQLPVTPTIHFLFTDRTGDSIIVEFVEGKMKFFTQNAGVMTNAPNYDWHMINIKNYLSLSNVLNDKSKNIGGVTELSQGTASLGLPGDYTSPSRFIRTIFLKHYADKPKNGNEAVTLVSHILNNVDLAKGVVTSRKGDLVATDHTQWVAIKNLTSNQFYFSDYEHRMTYARIDLDKIFASDKPFILPINQIQYPDNDVTKSMLN